MFPNNPSPDYRGIIGGFRLERTLNIIQIDPLAMGIFHCDVDSEDPEEMGQSC